MYLAAKRDGSRKKDRTVREGVRIPFDVLQAGNVRDFSRKETGRMIPCGSQDRATGLPL